MVMAIPSPAQLAGQVHFTPFSAARTLGLAPVSASTEPGEVNPVSDEISALNEHVFSSKEAHRKAERTLFNTPCCVLPRMT
jgi:hypothetical protein